MDVSDVVEPRVTRLVVYPVKGCAGQSCEAVDVEERGLAWDRRWMWVGEDRVFLSQRQVPAMATVQARIVGDELVLSHPRAGASVAVPTAPPASAPRGRVKIWRDEVEAVILPEPGRWASEVLGRRCELVFMPTDVRRLVNPAFANHTGEIVSFADGYPILLVGEASVADLNVHLEGTPVPMDRFRPNLVVSTAEPFVEDGWGELAIGGARLRGVKACARCAVPTVDQLTGERAGAEPIRTLSRYRRLGDGGIFFGQNLAVRGPGRIALGDRVNVLGRIPAVYRS